MGVEKGAKPSVATEAVVFRALDIWVFSGAGPVSFINRLLQYVREGLFGAWKDIRTHVEVSVDDNTNFSAEISGLKVVENDRGYVRKANEVHVFRLRNLTDGEREWWKEVVIPDFAGMHYALARWALNFISTGVFFLGIFALIFTPFSWQVGAACLGLGLVGWFLLRPWLRRRDLSTMDCSEAVMTWFHMLQRLAPYCGDPRNESPNTIYELLRNLHIYRQADLIYQTGKGDQ